ncbi:MAG: biotin/lipoyl-binding protein [Clostridiaceae bacterium]|nr:biotin/lipoyl-binding protein [Clostridia bacterium]MDY3869969.1 biotin/lipoyl-binding protein [Clostridiaceae bacterium]
MKKRGWVKNAVIAFLSIMLVLTFFSNTIMNRSLPEVATAFVESGTINAKIRGSGTVSAGESYDVVMDQTRKVSSVLVKVGDVVETGDVLFTLSETESDELKQAQDTLEDMRLNYQKSVLNMDSADYAQEKRNIQKAREALTEAKAEMENCAVSDDQIYQAQMTLKEAQRAQKDLEDALKKLQDDWSESTSRYDTLKAQITSWEKECETLSDAIDGYEKQIRSLKAGTGNLADDLQKAKDELKACQKTYADLRITYGTYYDSLMEKAKAIAAGNDIVIQMAALANKDDAVRAEKEAFEKLQPAVDAVDVAQAKVDALQALVDGQSSVQAQISQLEETLSQAEDDYSSRKKDIKSAKRELSDLEDEVADYKEEEDWYEQQIDSAGENVETLSDQYDQLKQLKSNYKAAEERVKDCQNSLDDLLFALAEQKKADGKTAASQQLDLEKARKDIQEQEERVAELKANALGAEVTAKVSGQISSLNVTAGRDAGAGETLAVIEVVDRGYTVRLPVTTEQSQKVRLGDKASVTNYYWGQQIDATLTQIINDPSNPGKGKLLVFTLTGDISSGQNVTLSVGEKSANYDTIVPNSALRTDTNGTFVLVVMAKSSPLGNRYIATRVDVQVLAQDDTTAAVSGLSFGDYVITTSSKPLEAGMQVNMVEN